MDKPLSVWYCDVCGGRIESPVENVGYVIWRSVTKPRDFKIIHKSKCDKREFHASMALEDFLGTDGLAMLTSMLSPGTVKRKLGDKGQLLPEDMDQFVDFFRRVQIPYYEEARRLFSDPDFLEWNSDNNEVGPYLPENLKKTIEKYGKRR